MTALGDCKLRLLLLLLLLLPLLLPLLLLMRPWVVVGSVEIGGAAA